MNFTQNLQTIPFPHPEVIARVQENEAVLVLPMRGQIKVLNDLGARIWTLINGQHSIQDIISILLEEYDISREIITADTQEFLNQLAERGIIIVK